MKKRTVDTSKLPEIKETKKWQKAKLRVLNGSGNCEIEWNRNEWEWRDRVFKINVNGNEVYLDANELAAYLRVM